jgi:hypothetical protein
MNDLSSAKNYQGEKGGQNTEQGTGDGKPEGDVPAWVVGRASSIPVLVMCRRLHGTEPAPKANSIIRNSNGCAVWLCLHAGYLKHSETGISERIEIFRHRSWQVWFASNIMRA